MKGRHLLPIFLTVLFLISNASYSVGQIKSDSSVRTTNSRLDSLTRQLNALEAERLMSREALTILEKTNQQVSLWWNPYGLLIAVIGVLFAILAIVATFILFRQSREYRSMLSQSIANYESIINKFIEEKKVEINSKIRETESQLAGATDKRKELESSLSELKKTKELLDAQLSRVPTFQSGSIGLTPSTGYSGFIGTMATPLIAQTEKKVTCSNPQCGYDFSTTEFVPAYSIGSGTFFSRRKCPKCGTEQLVFL